MKFKYYVSALFVFVVLLGLYVYSLSGESYTYVIPLTTNTITLPIALWFVVPVIVFFVIVILLEIGGLYRIWHKRNKYRQDYKILLEQLENQLLSREIPQKQPTMNRYKTLSILLSNLTFGIKEGVTLKSGDARLDELLGLLEDIQRGTYVNLRKFNPNEKSPFVRQNRLNQIKQDEKYAIEVLKKSNFDAEYKCAAFKKLLESDNTKEIKRFISEVKCDKELANTILSLCYAQKMDFSHDEIAQLCAEVEFGKQDYLLLAQKLKECYEPEEWVSLFEYLANKDESAEVAYMYVLLELEMIEEAKEYLRSHAENELLKVRAYLDLKDYGKKYPLELFLLD